MCEAISASVSATAATASAGKTASTSVLGVRAGVTAISCVPARSRPSCAGAITEAAAISSAISDKVSGAIIDLAATAANGGAIYKKAGIAGNSTGTAGDRWSSRAYYNRVACTRNHSDIVFPS
jgi:hypothetical protein